MNDPKPLAARECGAAQSDKAADPDATRLSERVVIENVTPEAGGAYPSKASRGDRLRVECDAYSDGHGELGVALRNRYGDEAWSEIRMQPIGNDRWACELPLPQCGTYWYTIVAWRDAFATWTADARKRIAAGQSMEVELEVARGIIEAAAQSAGACSARDDFKNLLAEFDALTERSADIEARLELVLGIDAQRLFEQAGPRAHRVTYPRKLAVHVERTKASFSAWYELLPRSQSGDEGRHGTFDDVIRRLPYIQDLGFDVLYLMPIHPIGMTNRKGRNNSLVAISGDPGSPYAIGGPEGGHDAIHPELGTLEDFDRLVREAERRGLEVALDLAIQCSLDHPWVREHPEWFDWLPDGSIRFAENPPKRYEDIVNVHFYRNAFPKLWHALRDVVLFWVDRGVKIFRVDNPHTKPFPFWEWLIRQVQARNPDVIFLSEAFTRPKIMRHLAKIGFSQSYTYFTWRNTKQELTAYLTELAHGASASYMRPNFFTNTPDINPFFLQTSGRPGFQIRLVLAATMSGNYGIYNGFELCESEAISGKEEYANSEKYQFKAWDWGRPGDIRDDIRLINRLRRESPALQGFKNITFYNAWNEHILYYGRRDPDGRDFLLVAVNLDPHEVHDCHFEIPLWEFGLADDAGIEAENIVTGERFRWTGKIQHMRLDPKVHPYLIWRLFPPEGEP